MGDTAVVPSWVAVPAIQVADCHRIAVWKVQHGAGTFTVAVAAALNWVTGGQESPITDVADEPTRERVNAEAMLGWGPIPHEVWVKAGVEPREPVTDDERWLKGAAHALGWLQGVHSRPPIELPRRTADGSTPSWEQLYQEEVEEHWYRAWEPEQRVEARNKAMAEAARHARLAELADSVT